jgi:hypothetical protein
MMLRKWVAVVTSSLGVILLVISCATPGSPPPPATPQTLPTAPALDTDILVIYHKSGGIAGIDETLTIHQGGVAEWAARGANPKSLLLSEPTILPIRRMLEQNEFSDLLPLYAAEGADLIAHTITARDASGKTKVVTAMDGAIKPDHLGLLLVMLENMRAIVAKNG